MQNGQRGVVLMELAVLATVAGTLPDKDLRRFVHRLRLRTENAASLPLKNGDELVGADVAFVLGSFLIAQVILS